MKLECAVVKDLYVLYSENELSPEVREAVEEHLRECENCRIAYEEETGFGDILNAEVEPPSKKLDEKLMMKLKISRLKTILLFISTVFIIVLFSVYSQSRIYLQRDFQELTKNTYHLTLHLGNLKSHEKVEAAQRNVFNSRSGELLRKTNEIHELVYRNINPIEKYTLSKLNSTQCFDLSVTTLALMLNNRYENGHWSDPDEKVYNILMNELDALWRNMNQQGSKITKKYYIINTRSLLNRLHNINELARIYTKYNKLPGEISFLSEAELKERIQYVTGEKSSKIDLTKSLNFDYNFRIGSKTSAYGLIDSHTGRIKEYNSSGPVLKGELLPLDEAKKAAKEIILRNYGSSFDVKIEDLGLNYNYTSSVDTKLYSFKVKPTYMGYKIFEPVYVYVDARTNIIESFKSLAFKGITPLAAEADLTIDIKLNPDEALNNINLHKLNKADFEHYDTFFMKSMFSGSYVLVHGYKEKGKDKPDTERFYINTTTGKIEWPAYEEGFISY
jgi:hypothetical protein